MAKSIADLVLFVFGAAMTIGWIRAVASSDGHCHAGTCEFCDDCPYSGGCSYFGDCPE